VISLTTGATFVHYGLRVPVADKNMQGGCLHGVCV